MSYTLENVTENIKVWFNKDPVRPELGVGFKTSHGREVYALKNNSLKDDLKWVFPTFFIFLTGIL